MGNGLEKEEDYGWKINTNDATVYEYKRGI